MKRILGLDLGTTSIGWAYVLESENIGDSEIKALGVRISQLDNFVSTETGKESKDPLKDFSSGKGISPNAGRTLKRSTRRSLQRFKLRRENLIDALISAKIIDAKDALTEIGKDSTFQTWELRAKAVTEKIEKIELARVLLAINKKRGYKSSRKLNTDEDGKAVDSMGIAKKLYEENLTPGQLVYNLLYNLQKVKLDFYRSDLLNEFDKIYNYQAKFYPNQLTPEFYNTLEGKNRKTTGQRFFAEFKVTSAEIKTFDKELQKEQFVNMAPKAKKRLQSYLWRTKALSEKLDLEIIAYVLGDINQEINQSSGYLGAISDRSKHLYFNNITIGQYLFEKLKENRHSGTKNLVFYRQDYLDEFEKIWETQSKFHPELTLELKNEIRDVIIFYQRKLKSQKNALAICELEGKIIEQNGKKVNIGPRVIPRSSPLFQEFKIWQILHNLKVKRKAGSTIVSVDEIEIDNVTKSKLFDELNVRGKLSAAEVLKVLGLNKNHYELNYTELEGNETNKALFDAYLEILDFEGYEDYGYDVSKLKETPSEIREMFKSIFSSLGIHTEILEFDALNKEVKLESQLGYRLWHLLYSYEGDNSKTGNEKLFESLEKDFGFKREHAAILANIRFKDDYGKLSSKAIKKIYPYITQSNYSSACEFAGYKHSKNSLTKEELESRVLKKNLELLPKNSLRNPVVEKILNQMINVVNTLLFEQRKIDPNFKFDEIRVELARELKKNAKERADMTAQIASSTAKHEKIIDKLKKEFGIKNPTKNDVIRYKLWEELKNNCWRDLYQNIKIGPHQLFSKEIDIEHIIPKALLFDDSFSNKTLAFREFNLRKGSKTGFDYLKEVEGQEKFQAYLQRVEMLYAKGPIEGISKAKYLKLLKAQEDIGDGFIERDLRESQYIAKKAKDLLFEITPRVVTTTGSITDKLRNDWGLVNVMKELNLPKYKALGLTEYLEMKDGNQKEVIVDWTKRNDHRHHAMDALTVAFTKPAHIQYLNYLSARKNEKHEKHGNIIGIEKKEVEVVGENGSRKWRFKEPVTNLRQEALKHLEGIFISHKAKNKVVTKNKNKISTTNGVIEKPELTPRGQLHKETVYGKLLTPIVKLEKVSAKFDKETIDKVTKPIYRAALLKRLEENGNDPKKAFSGKNALDKNPIILPNEKKVPLEVKVLHWEENYTIRKEISPELQVKKVIDLKVRKILEERLAKFDKDPKKAFTNLDLDPIWLNKEKGIAVKRVTISGVSNAEPLHYKKDHFGNNILDTKGNKIPVDFVSTGNNHHVAIYKDSEGNLQENVVSFYEAVARVNQDLPIIDKNYNSHLGWEFLFSMKQNEMFVFPNEKTGFNPSEIDLLDPKNRSLISPNLFRVQKFTNRDYFFRHHLETNVENNGLTKNITWIRTGLNKIDLIVKLRLNHLGFVVEMGEY
ncbi:MAG: type II CRISPR RNA-guided endonuclease Cas9 [Luteibaculaceae bacterium]